MSEFKLDPRTHIGSVHLTVSDLEQALAFYGEALGFQRRQTNGDSVELGVAESDTLILLTGNPHARPKPPGTTGLYHFAIRVPSRESLAEVLVRLRNAGVPLQGASDHGVSEALYLADPDGNGIEIYRDRPREDWLVQDGEVQMMTAPLDLRGLLGSLEQTKKQQAVSPHLPAGTDIGHVHLHVADLAKTEEFYCDVLGMDLVQRYGGSALFFSVGGYHHHVGANIWAGRGAPPPPDDAVGLRYFTLRLPDDDAMERLVAHLRTRSVDYERLDHTLRMLDPSGNPVHLTIT